MDRLPTQKYQKEGGALSYTRIIEFTSDDAHRRFQEQAIDAIDRHLSSQEAPRC